MKTVAAPPEKESSYNVSQQTSWTCPHCWANYNVIFLNHTLFAMLAAYTSGDTFPNAP
jgi:hypothetical protein